MANSMTILTTKNVPINLSVTETVDFSKGISINSKVLISGDGVIADSSLVIFDSTVTNPITVKAKIASIDTAISNLTTDLSTLEGKVDTNITAIANLTETVNTNTANISTLTGKVSTLEGTVGDSTKGLVKKVADIETSIGDDDTPSSIKGRITANEEDIEGLRGDLGNKSDASTLTTAFGRIKAVEEAIGGGGSIGTRVKALEDSVGTASDAASATGTVYARIKQNVADITANLNSINDVKEVIGTASDEASASGSLYARIKQNAADISAVNTKVGTPDDLAKADGNLYARAKWAKAQIDSLDLRASDLEALIPSEASASNQLADKDFVNSSIQTATAYFDGNWDTLADVPTTEAGFTEAGLPVPGPNNYLVVVADESHSNQTWRYKYTGTTGQTYSKALWVAEYKINDTALTAAQLAALNSGITAALVAKYSGYEATITDHETRIAANEANISSLQTTVGDASSGLVKDVADNATAIAAINTAIGSAATEGSILYRIATNETNIASLTTRMGTAETAIAAINTEIGADTTAGSIKGRIKALEDGIGSSYTAGQETVKGHIKDAEDAIDDLETTVGDASSGLVKGVADNLASINAIRQVLETTGVTKISLPVTFIKKVDGGADKTYQLDVDANDNLVFTKLS